MIDTNVARSPTSVRTLRRWVFAVVSLALCASCGDAAPNFGFPVGGSSGTGGTSGIGGSAGTGGTGAASGGGGTGGTAGTGASGGSGGMAGSGGTAGTGGTMGACATTALCHTCPDQFLCDTDGDCAFSGYVCVPSGCETHAGAAIKQCQPSRGGSCLNDAECPNVSDYDCMPVGAGGKRCVRVTAGCDPVTEAYDCVPGFSCEGETCVDRRVPCDDFGDCPKSHVCSTTPTSSFCVRVSRTCHEDVDCAGFGEFCADVDSDGTKECTGEIGSTGNACVNAACGTSSAPVCETGASGTNSSCGDYGLCRNNADCDVAGGFACVGLWQDGRKECVRTGGTCNEVTDCDPQEVCAAPRAGGAPSCQVGTAL
jgi:hypothetical protein